MHWIQFLISAGFIIFAGVRLTDYTDQLSDRLNLGKVWIGIVLLGFVTSLPEAITCIISIVTIGANDLAIGNLLGSNNFNPLLIVMMDVIYRKGSITSAIDPDKSQRYSAFFAILLTLVVILELFILPTQNAFLQISALGPLSLGSIVIAVVYFLGMYVLSQSSKKDASCQKQIHDQVSGVNSKTSLGMIIFHLVVAAMIVVVSAMFLAKSADRIAEATGLGRTFVGTILLALVTSLPEMVVTISAVRIGSFGLAIGNIFGSNMTNMFIVVICGLVYSKGPILATVSNTHILTGFLSIIITGIALVGLSKQSKKTYLGLGLDSWLMCIVFLSGTVILYSIR